MIMVSLLVLILILSTKICSVQLRSNMMYDHWQNVWFAQLKTYLLILLVAYQQICIIITVVLVAPSLSLSFSEFFVCLKHLRHKDSLLFTYTKANLCF